MQNTAASREPGEVTTDGFINVTPMLGHFASEVIRQSSGDGRVTVSRAAGSMTFPAELILVAALNPCACGSFGNPQRECRSRPVQVRRYATNLRPTTKHKMKAGTATFTPGDLVPVT